MIHKKVIAAAATLVAATLLLAGCSSTSSNTSAKKVSVVMIPGIAGNPFYLLAKNGGEAAAKKYGYSFSFQGASAFTPESQTPIVNSVCANKPTFLLIAPTDPTAMRVPIQNCINAGVKVITFDTQLANPAGLVTQVITNSEGCGALAADYTGKELGGVGTVVPDQGVFTVTTGKLRSEGFSNEIKKKFPNMKLLTDPQSPAQDNSRSESASILAAHPDLKGYFAGTPTGAVLTFQAAKRPDIVVTGMDATDQEVAQLKAGTLSALVIQRPAEEAAIAIDAIHDVETGKTSSIKSVNEIQCVLVTKQQANDANVQQYYYKVG